MQGSKLTLEKLQNANEFDNLRVRAIFTSKLLRVGIIHVFQSLEKAVRRTLNSGRRDYC